MSHKPRDLFPATLRVAKTFLRKYDQAESGKEEAKEALCEKYDVPKREAFRWIHVVRPHFQNQDDPWPFYDDIEDRALDPSKYDDEAQVDPSVLAYSGPSDHPSGSVGESPLKFEPETVTVEARDELAELIGVDPSTIWRSVDQNREAKGYPIYEWARLNKRGHIDHFEVPAGVDFLEETSDDEGEESDDGPVVTEGKKPSFYEGDLVQIAPNSLYEERPNPGEVTDVDRTNGQIRVQFPQGSTGWMGKGHFEKLENQDRGVSHAHSEEARPEDPASSETEDTEHSTPGGWSWDKDYVYNAAQDTYLFHLSQYEGAPFVVEGDKLRRMVRRYSKHAGDRAWNLDEVAAAEGMPRDAWQEIKQNLGITHTSPPHLPEDFQREDDIEGMAADDVQKKKHEWKKQNEQKTYRELKNAAKKWFQLEGVMEEASQALMSSLQDYRPPEVSASNPDVGAPSAALYNNQDWHIGARPKEGADQFSVEEYCDGLVEKSERAIGDALNLRSLDTFYMVVGGDLVHSDNFDGSTTEGTDLDMACGHAEAVKRAVETSIRVADLARSAANEVVILPVPGNHDRALSTAAALAVSHHYNQAEDVRCLPINDRQYVTYCSHLICVTHGDIKKKALRNIGETIRAEARNELGRTAYTTLATGHFHYRSRDVEDKSGRVHYQAPSPVPTDRWHNREAFVGSRKGVQLVLLDQEDGGDHVIHA